MLITAEVHEKTAVCNVFYGNASKVFFLKQPAFSYGWYCTRYICFTITLFPRPPLPTSTVSTNKRIQIFWRWCCRLLDIPIKWWHWKQRDDAKVHCFDSWCKFIKKRQQEKKFKAKHSNNNSKKKRYGNKEFFWNCWEFGTKNLCLEVLNSNFVLFFKELC